MIFLQIRTPQELNDYKLPELGRCNKEVAIREAEKYLDYTVPFIPMSLYMDFRRTGNRSRYESPYFEKRRILTTLVLAEYLERKNRFSDKIVDLVYSILGEASWTVSAHNLYIRDTCPLILPDTSRPVIDLFSAETGAILAVAYTLLKEIFCEETYHFMFKQIEFEIGRRIHVPYITDHFWWMGDGSEEINNWGPWCTLNTLLCFFLMPTDQRLRKKAFQQALYTLECFTKDYAEDGYCSEGAGYYSKAALCMAEAIEVLDQVSSGALQEVYKNPKIINMISFIEKMHISGPYYVNYADCSARPGYAGAREFRAAGLIGDEKLMSFARKQYEEADERSRFLLDEYSFFMRLIAFTEQEKLDSISSTYDKRKDQFLPSSCLNISFKGEYAFSVKGGDNNDSHNHNDISSITLYKKGRPVLIDIGVEEYTAKTFSPERYEIWTMRSRYHNTLNFESFEQLPGRQYRAILLDRHEEEGRLLITFDLKDAFEKGKVEKYLRHLSFSAEGLEVREETRCREKKILTFMLKDKPLIKENRIILGEEDYIEIESSFEKLEVESFLIDDAKLNLAWGRGSYIYRILVTSQEDDIRWKIR